jgi:hypothetical protein
LQRPTAVKPVWHELPAVSPVKQLAAGADDPVKHLAAGVPPELQCPAAAEPSKHVFAPNPVSALKSFNGIIKGFSYFNDMAIPSSSWAWILSSSVWTP